MARAIKKAVDEGVLVLRDDKGSAYLDEAWTFTMDWNVTPMGSASITAREMGIVLEAAAEARADLVAYADDAETDVEVEGVGAQVERIEKLGLGRVRLTFRLSSDDAQFDC